jgi:hypothetical protein
VLRLFRLFRLARAVRLLVQFRTLWMLIQGLINSCATIMHTFSLMLMLLFIFGCIGMEIITIPYQHDPGLMGQMVKENFANIPRTMLTLVRCVNFDGCAAMYEPMVDTHNHLVLFFLPFLGLISITLMNLVTAVIVEGALEQARDDKLSLERERQLQMTACIPTIKEIFTKLDTNGDGILTIEEVMAASDEIRTELAKSVGMKLSEDSFVTLHQVMDEDGSGEITVDEFCAGLPKLCCSEAPLELFAMMKTLQHMNRDFHLYMHGTIPEDKHRHSTRGNALPRHSVHS